MKEIRYKGNRWKKQKALFEKYGEREIKDSHIVSDVELTSAEFEALFRTHDTLEKPNKNEF